MKFVHDGILIGGSEYQRQFTGLLLIGEIAVAWIRQSLGQETPSWDRVLVSYATLLLQGFCGDIAEDIAQSSGYDWMELLARRHGLSRPARQDEKNCLCIVRAILIIALRFGQVYGRSIEEVLRHTASRPDRVVQWKFSERPVFCKQNGVRGSPIMDKSMTTNSFNGLFQVMVLSAGIRNKMTSHSKLREAARYDWSEQGLMLTEACDQTYATIPSKPVGSYQVLQLLIADPEEEGYRRFGRLNAALQGIGEYWTENQLDNLSIILPCSELNFSDSIGQLLGSDGQTFVNFFSKINVCLDRAKDQRELTGIARNGSRDEPTTFQFYCPRCKRCSNRIPKMVRQHEINCY
ncbi:hypothetical protein BO71DRAFT_431281 [Aspergillus ellipticus CBS 707.79]|uniref:Uncharacterized protein n=1 Tax=Aspergillus ellipticus CBS 707.79 TaxID=1448320 RepID=A0A319D7H8_9EURO|nr:hypothetical protein BO71DRAFT_431281 [Aspergillus ellipticus CBS 707.79]